MAAYMIANINVTDPTGFEEYRRLVGPTIEKYGGKYLVRGATPEVIEGSWDPKRLVVLEFESVERARQWHTSQEYSSVRLIGQKVSSSEVVFVQGV